MAISIPKKTQLSFLLDPSSVISVGDISTGKSSAAKNVVSSDSKTLSIPSGMSDPKTAQLAEQNRLNQIMAKPVSVPTPLGDLGASIPNQAPPNILDDFLDHLFGQADIKDKTALLAKLTAANKNEPNSEIKALGDLMIPQLTNDSTSFNIPYEDEHAPTALSYKNIYRVLNHTFPREWPIKKENYDTLFSSYNEEQGLCLDGKGLGEIRRDLERKSLLVSADPDAKNPRDAKQLNADVIKGFCTQMLRKIDITASEEKIDEALKDSATVSGGFDTGGQRISNYLFSNEKLLSLAVVKDTLLNRFHWSIPEKTLEHFAKRPELTYTKDEWDLLLYYMASKQLNNRNPADCELADVKMALRAYRRAPDAATDV